MKIKTIPPEYYALVEQVARRVYRRVSGTGINFDDLIQEGLIGYLGAIKRLDPNHTSAKAFLTTRINGAMLDFLRTEDPLSQRRRRLKKKLERIAEHITITMGREAKIAEIALEAGLTVEEVGDVLMPVHRVDNAVLEMIPDHVPHVTDSTSATLDVFVAHAGLNETEDKILRLTREGHSQKHIAVTLGVSEPRISQRLAEIVAKLQRAAKRTEWPDNQVELKPIPVLPPKANESEVTMSKPVIDLNGQNPHREYHGKLDRCRQEFRNHWFGAEQLVQRGIFPDRRSATLFLVWVNQQLGDRLETQGPNGSRQYRFLSKDEIAQRSTAAQAEPTPAITIPVTLVPNKPIPAPAPSVQEPVHQASRPEGATIIERLYAYTKGKPFRMNDITHQPVGAKDRKVLQTSISIAFRLGVYLSTDEKDPNARNKLYKWSGEADRVWKKREAAAPAASLEGRYRFQIGASELKIWAAHKQKPVF